MSEPIWDAPWSDNIESGDTVETVEVDEVEQHHGQFRFADRFTKRHGREFLHVHGLGWHQWDSTRWSECRDGAPERAVKALIGAAYTELAGLGRTESDSLYAEIRKCSSAHGMHGILEVASTQLPCAIYVDKMDVRPELFNTLSGTLDLATGKIGDPDPFDHLTKCAGAEFDPDARSEVWESFLGRILPDPAVLSFVQRLFGYAMLGVVREHVMPIFTGEGANGKGTLRDAILAAFGDYGCEVDPELLMAAHNPRHLTFLMELRGRRLVFCSETERGRSFAESQMKRLVGGDPIQANRMRENPLTFDPTHTLVMTTNHLPNVSGDDPAVWRRILVVPFDVVIPEDERDGTLPEHLREPDTQAAVLAWVYQGYLDYQEQGLNPPDVVRARTEEYKTDSDGLGRFLTEQVVRGRAHTTTSSALYTRYEEWCRENGEPVSTKTAFGKEMKRRHNPSSKSGGQMVYVGLGLVPKEEATTSFYN